MPTQTVFPLSRISALRRRAAKAAQANPDWPDGWSISTTDPTKVVSVFRVLSVKPGFVLRAYQYKSGGNGSGFVWAMPSEANFPEPDLCPRLKGVFLEPPKPMDALDNFMEAIDGDGSPFSYLCASILARELAEFGAMWHGCWWSDVKILDSDPTEADAVRVGSGRKRETDWQWHQAKPAQWEPEVVEDEAHVTVTLHVFSELGERRVLRMSDMYVRGSYEFVSDTAELASAPGGFVY